MLGTAAVPMPYVCTCSVTPQPMATSPTRSIARAFPYYFVYWEGYDDLEASWEPIENLGGATEEVRAFDDIVGCDEREKERHRLVAEPKKRAKEERAAARAKSEEDALAEATAEAQAAGVTGGTVDGEQWSKGHKMR